MYQVLCRSEQYLSTFTPKSILKIWPGRRTLSVGAEWAPISWGPLNTAGQLLTSQAAAKPIFSRSRVIQSANSFSLIPGLDCLADPAVNLQGFLAGQFQPAQFFARLSAADLGDNCFSRNETGGKIGPFKQFHKIQVIAMGQAVGRGAVRGKIQERSFPGCGASDISSRSVLGLPL